MHFLLPDVVERQAELLEHRLKKPCASHGSLASSGGGYRGKRFRELST
jgi:hypothetical protein